MGPRIPFMQPSLQSQVDRDVFEDERDSSPFRADAPSTYVPPKPQVGRDPLTNWLDEFRKEKRESKPMARLPTFTRRAPSDQSFPSYRGPIGFSEPPLNTSENSPINVLWISPLDTGTPGKIGLTLCPGRNGIGRSGNYKRTLSTDMRRLREEHKVKVLVPLIEEFEYTKLAVPAYFTQAATFDMEVCWYPIVDGDVPVSLGKTKKLVSEIVRRMRAGDNVVTHCMAGLGRGGTITACVLTHLGYTAKEAIEMTRAVRKGAVQNTKQELFVARFQGAKPPYVG